MLKSLFCTEKLQFHTERHASFLKEWNHQWTRITSEEKFINIKSKARPSSANCQPEQWHRAVFQRMVFQTSRPAWCYSASRLWNTHKTLETLLFPLGSRGPDKPWGRHHCLSQVLPTGWRSGRAQQDASAAPGWPLGSLLRGAGPSQDVLPSQRPTRYLGDARVSLFLISLFSCR